MVLDNTEKHNVVFKKAFRYRSAYLEYEVWAECNLLYPRLSRKIGSQRTETDNQRPCCNEGFQQWRHIMSEKIPNDLLALGMSGWTRNVYELSSPQALKKDDL